jgi:hypothetical protein
VQFDNFMLEAKGPELQINRVGGNVVLSWFGGGTLQSSGSLVPTAWNPVAGVVSVDGANSVSIPIGGEQYFRVAY